MHLCDALDTEAPPVMVYEKSGSANVQIGSQIGVRIMDVDGHHEISYAFLWEALGLDRAAE